MLPPITSYYVSTIYRLGTWYTVYRLIIAFSLIFIFLQDRTQPDLFVHQDSVFFYTLLIYAMIGVVQMLILRFIPHIISKQLIALFIIDIIYLSILNFSNSGLNLAISLLFVITLFAANFLLHKTQALLLTLISIICIIYPYFFFHLFNFKSFNSISHSLFLTFLFFIIYAIGQIFQQRFQFLEKLNSHQSIELSTLQNINRYILDQIDVGYLVLDEQSHIILSNPAATSLLGLSSLYQHEQFRLQRDQPDLFELFKSTIVEDKTHFQFLSKISSYKIDVKVQKLIVPNQSLTMLIVQDAQVINQQVQQLKLASLGQLSASIAHEIRNPLAAIVQANELSLDCDKNQKMTLHNIISKQSKRIDKIITDTLNLAKNKTTVPCKIDLTLFFNSIIQHEFSNFNEQIHLDIGEGLFIFFDESQLIQILHNLIRNALRHNAKEAPYIIIKAYQLQKNIFIDVIDFGKGVNKSDLSQLFTAFFSTEIDGTGLGLYLSHNLCEANQSKLIYVEQNNIGTCFRIVCNPIF